MSDTTHPSPADLVEPLARTVRAYHDELAEVAQRHGLTTAQARALIALDQPLSMRALADHLVCDASNATGLIARMEARGLVRRETAPHDRRSKVVTPTAPGRELAHRLRSDMHRLHTALTALTPAERAALLPLLDRLGDLLER
ncbi:MarR family winged helix-turn-helix transcriptional regulator [Streptantibioticus cattleyicolor]|uniref:Transcriptional regulator, MarR family n=1 Tax=Streptantibioticus cattleyicolor (strain ATCC 35852 / DSM 46488 / JCM 4925 / NBRC 14057 / NRRL 8057) TaxID=1003195 RepID=F8JMS3_STREN|nr:MarR family transcriptional regulator [Streptantibioticus cattleyicolor]AEW99291.1 transcriptional regulator, MarR family [Streptantibioticus cattleyicolor NRRL 8057 = DSM 46488]CCB71669.1 Transcriptional regulator, MarR family [Streptantibioticus cattleyicolor NRRL 8057 = DSM 46488]